jgi:hypothetical protein
MIAPGSSSAVWAIPTADGSAVIEVCRKGNKYVVVIESDGDRRQDSVRGMTFERAKARAEWLARASLPLTPQSIIDNVAALAAERNTLLFALQRIEQEASRGDQMFSHAAMLAMIQRYATAAIAKATKE